MNTNLHKELFEIAEHLGAATLVEQLSYLRERESMSQKELIIPLVGEYSSGKTSLLNALTGGIKLETGHEPTTASIFEIYFSQASERAVALYDDGRTEEISDFTNIRNSDISGIKLIRIYDTATAIPAATILVDTPGLSSLEPKHRTALSGYLPKADAVFTVVDVNQGITASLLKFLEVARLARRRIYIIITKCDSKSSREIEEVREYIRNNTKLDIKHIVCVSAEKGNLEEFFKLIQIIQNEKNAIVAEVVEEQLQILKTQLLEHIQFCLDSSSLSNDELDENIRKLKNAQNEINVLLKRIIAAFDDCVDSAERNAIVSFNRRIFDNLEDTAKNPPRGFDINAVAEANINDTANLVFANYKSDVTNGVRRICQEQTGGKIDMSHADFMSAARNMGEIDRLNMTVDLSLPELQKVNKMTAMGIKVAAAALTFGVAAKIAGGVYLLGKAAVTAVKGVGAGKAIDIIDTASDVGSIISNRKTRLALEDASQNQTAETSLVPAGQNSFAAPFAQEKKGILETLISTITEQTHAKPQRKKLIDDYIVFHLQPDFKARLEQIGNDMLINIETLLVEGSQETLAQIKGELENLKQQRTKEKGEFEQKITELKKYQALLENKGV
jgi:GTPase Era involved in 16S rRNA processing